MILRITTESGSTHWINTEDHTAFRQPGDNAPELEPLVEYMPNSLHIWPGEPMIYHYLNGGHFPIRRETTPVVKVEEV